ncbi:hypothetical protein NDU88_007588 [Pleurodeles waltl]|uniref:Secreted protein n=1 Tax=Pleurodeles waltl TaxID=8319 RepID=A0AAV7VU93_PLEWA|nr:hypothetical protein NDU88_007588 [Pleurodeles waltl]
MVQCVASCRCWCGGAGILTCSVGGREAEEAALPQTRGRGSSPSARPLAPWFSAGSPGLCCRSLHRSRGSRASEGSPRPFTMEFFLFPSLLWRADRGTWMTRLRPPSRSLFTGRLRVFRITVAGRCSHESGAR